MKGSEIKNLDFRVGFLGFKKADVKACLEEISEYVLKLENKIYNLEIEKDKLKNQINKIEISQTNFKDIITSAQEFKKRIEKETEEKAERLIKKAEEKAGELIKKAKNQYEEILIGIKDEKSKFGLLKREIGNLKNNIINTNNNIITKLENFEGMIEIKEKNVSLSETISSNVEEKHNEHNENEKIFKVEKNADIVKDNISISENEDLNKTLEFNTKPINNKPVNNDASYIKSKFQEIEFKK